MLCARKSIKLVLILRHCGKNNLFLQCFELYFKQNSNLSAGSFN